MFKGGTAAAGATAEQDLPLSYARTLSWLSLLVIMATSLVLSFFIANSAREALLTRQENFSRLLAENLNHQIYRRFALPTLLAHGRIALRQPSQYDRLDQVVQSVVHGLPMERLRIYDFTRVVAYSTSKEELGRMGVGPESLDSTLRGGVPKPELISNIPDWRAIFHLPLPSGTFVLRTLYPLRGEPLQPGAEPPIMGALELTQDITSDYEWIYANYEGFEGDKDLNYIHASNQYQDFAAKLRFMYGNLGDYFDHAVSYPWVGYLFTGMTPDEVQELAAASHQYWADYGRYAEETWTSPVELPGKTGIVSIDFITGLTFTDELKDLYATLQANGIDVYIVSASPIDTVLAANETMGYNLPEDHVYAMRNKLGEDGRYINEYNYDWGGEGKYAQTQGEGKSTIITNFIAPQYDNAGPLMVFGDSSGDWNMMTDWMESGDTELGVIFNRYRKPSSDPIWQGSNEAAQSIGDPDARFVLQGRDENTGELRPSEKSILLGETDEVLVRPAE